MHASLLGFCLESLVIDNDIIGAAQRTIRGIEVNEEAIAFETIRDVCLNGPGHYLGCDQTLQLMQTEYVYPVVGDRRSPNDWLEQGGSSVSERAEKKVAEILATHFPKHVLRADRCGNSQPLSDPARTPGYEAGRHVAPDDITSPGRRRYRRGWRRGLLDCLPPDQDRRQPTSFCSSGAGSPAARPGTRQVWSGSCARRAT